MRNNIFLREASNISYSNDVLRATTLQYLRDALLREEYEGCKELVERAREFGVQNEEIQALLAAAAQNEGGEPSEAVTRKNRLFK